MSELVREERQRLSDVENPQKFLHWLQSQNITHAHRQTIALTQLRLGDVPNALNGLRTCVDTLDDDDGWQGRGAAAREQLVQWEATTRQALKLPPA
ncbi:MAG: hypothetical protein ACO1OB_15880 [Archangium sp.]